MDMESLSLSGEKQLAFFGVYDGHTGDYVSEYLRRNFHQVFHDILSATMKRKKGQWNFCRSWLVMIHMVFVCTN
jgi:serine/threonine protein phosphatase PrpC